MRMRKKTDQKLLDSKVTFTVTMPFFRFLSEIYYSIRGGDDLFNTLSVQPFHGLETMSLNPRIDCVNLHGSKNLFNHSNLSEVF